jgi:hypothetical protein
MRPRRTSLVLLVVASTLFALEGCGCPRKLDGLNTQLQELYVLKMQALGANPPASTAETEAKLAAVAHDAEQGAKECQDLAPAFYRVAAVAAWQADGAGAALVNPIGTQGIAVCEALPAKDNSAPRDCTLIRIAPPMALQDELTKTQLVLRRRAEQSADGTLPADTLSELRKLLQGYADAARQLTAIRRQERGLSSPQALLDQTDRQRLIVYCNARETFALMGKVEGMTLPNLATERPPLDEIKASLQADAIDLSGPQLCTVPLTVDSKFLTSP